MPRKMTIDRRAFLRSAAIGGAGIAAGSLWPRSVASGTKPAERAFTIVHYTDVHVQPELNAARGFAQAIYNINHHRADFALSGGDLVFDVLKADRDRCDRLWKLYTSLSREFDMPVHETMGNHDNFALSNSAISSGEPGYGKQTFLERLGRERTYTSFDHRGWHFVILDSILPKPGGWEARLGPEQMDWLKSDLAAKGNAPTVVSLHVPVITFYSQVVDGPYAANPSGRAMADAKDLRELFEGSNVKLVLQGHVHIREQFEYNGIRYITSGAVSGSWWNGPRYGHPEGYATVSFSGEDFTWTYHTYGWAVKQQAQMNEDDRRILRQMYAEREVFALV